MPTPRVPIPSAALAAVCQEFEIAKLSLFGSVLRDDFGVESDIDVLIEFNPGRAPGFLTLAHLSERIGDLFPGRRVDVLTPGFLSRHFRAAVLAEAHPVIVDGHVAA